MGKKHEAPSRLFFTTPLKNNADKAVAVAYEQFLRERGMHHGIGGAMEFISKRAPALRTAFTKTHSHRGLTA